MLSVPLGRAVIYVEDSDGRASERLCFDVDDLYELSMSSSSSPRRDNLRRGFARDVLESLRDFRLEIVDTLSSSSSLRFDFDTSEPAFDRPEPERPKLNIVANVLSCAT